MRKIIQICTLSTPTEDHLFALCNDGAVFGRHLGEWNKIPEIPQDKEIDGEKNEQNKNG